MPYIKTTTNLPLPGEKCEAIKTQLAEAVQILGKTENFLMVDFCSGNPLYFKGSSQPAAIISVDVYGASGADAYNRFTAAVTAMLEQQLGLPADRVFVKYSEYQHWGWNGANF